MSKTSDGEPACLRKHTTTRPGSGRASNSPSGTEGWWRRWQEPPPPRGPAGAPEPRERRQPPQRSDLRRALHRVRRTNLRKHTAVSPGGGNHGGWELGWGRGAPPSREPAGAPGARERRQHHPRSVPRRALRPPVAQNQPAQAYRSQPCGRQSNRAGAGLGTGGWAASAGELAGAHQQARR